MAVRFDWKRYREVFNIAACLMVDDALGCEVPLSKYGNPLTLLEHVQPTLIKISQVSSPSATTGTTG